jgi:multidrug transporter EmrE-like cation transporter
MTILLNGYFWCALASLASAGATFLIKLSHQAGSGWTLARLGYLGAACAVYGMGFVCYTITLQKLPMTIAYPLMTAITMMAVLLCGYAVLGEALTGVRLLGMALVAVGAFALVR